MAAAEGCDGFGSSVFSVPEGMLYKIVVVVVVMMPREVVSLRQI
jgi:hypothetical protein